MSIYQYNSAKLSENHWLTCGFLPDDDEDLAASARVTSILVFIVYILYIVTGALVIALYNKVDYVNSLYFTYICVAALDFGALIPER